MDDDCVMHAQEYNAEYSIDITNFFIERVVLANAQMFYLGAGGFKVYCLYSTTVLQHLYILLKEYYDQDEDLIKILPLSVSAKQFIEQLIEQLNNIIYNYPKTIGKARGLYKITIPIAQQDVVDQEIKRLCTELGDVIASIKHSLSHDYLEQVGDELEQRQDKLLAGGVQEGVAEGAQVVYNARQLGDKRSRAEFASAPSAASAKLSNRYLKLYLHHVDLPSYFANDNKAVAILANLPISISSSHVYSHNYKKAYHTFLVPLPAAILVGLLSLLLVHYSCVVGVVSAASYFLILRLHRYALTSSNISKCSFSLGRNFDIVECKLSVMILVLGVGVVPVLGIYGNAWLLWAFNIALFNWCNLGMMHNVSLTIWMMAAFLLSGAAWGFINAAAHEFAAREEECWYGVAGYATTGDVAVQRAL